MFEFGRASVSQLTLTVEDAGGNGVAGCARRRGGRRDGGTVSTAATALSFVYGAERNGRKDGFPSGRHRGDLRAGRDSLSGDQPASRSLSGPSTWAGSSEGRASPSEG